MNRKCLAIGIILLFIGVTITPTINFNTVKASQQNLIKERINQRELLFQTIVDIANNKEIQRIILKSQMSRGIFPTSEFPVITKNQLKMMYFLGLIFSKLIRTSKMQSVIEKYQLSPQKMQKEINAVIDKNPVLSSKIIKLQNSECDCENDNSTEYPILCGILTIIFIVLAVILFPFKLIFDIFMGIFNGTLVESFVVFFGLMIDAILFPIILLLGITLYLILFIFSCWDIAPLSTIK